MHRNNLFLLSTFVVGGVLSLAVFSTFTFRLTGGTGYYGELAEAFSHKQLHLLQNPPAELLSLENPYDPDENHQYRKHDASLYEGKYYLYWGFFPAVVRLLSQNMLSEREAIFFYALLLQLGVLGNLKVCLRHLRDEGETVSIGKTQFLMLYGILALAAPTTYFWGVSGIYFEAIIAAQSFFLLGMYFLLESAERENKQFWNLMIASSFFGMAVASRMSYLPASALLLLLFFLRKQGFKKVLAMIAKTPKNLILNSLAIFTPFTIFILLIALYNTARFGSPSNAGVRYILAAYNVQEAIDADTLSSVYYLSRNVGNYFFALPEMVGRVPYFQLSGQYYVGIEAVVYSLFIIAPITLFYFFRSSASSILRRDADYWVLAGLLLLAPLLLLQYSSTRYILDFSISMVLGGMSIFVAVLERKNLLFNVLLFVLFLYSFFIAAYFWVFAIRQYQPERYQFLMQQIQKTLPASFLEDIYYQDRWSFIEFHGDEHVFTSVLNGHLFVQNEKKLQVSDGLLRIGLYSRERSDLSAEIFIQTIDYDCTDSDFAVLEQTSERLNLDCVSGELHLFSTLKRGSNHLRIHFSEPELIVVGVKVRSEARPF